MEKITFKDLKKDRLKSMKIDKVKAEALMMLIDKIEKLAKVNNSDPDLFIIDGVKKYLKELNDSKSTGMNVEDELKIINEYAEKILPKQLNETIVSQIIIELINDDPKINLGYIMKYFNIHYKNRVEMKMVKDIASALIKNKEIE